MAVMLATIAPWAVGTTSAASPTTLYLHKADTALTASPPATKGKAHEDSSSLSFDKGNAWNVIETWSAAPAITAGNLLDLGDLHVWLGRHGGENEIDLRAQVHRNGDLIAEGIERCIGDLASSDKDAWEVVVALSDPAVATFNGTSDVLSITISARIGTNLGTECLPTGKKPKDAGVRVHYDSVAVRAFNRRLPPPAARPLAARPPSPRCAPGPGRGPARPCIRPDTCRPRRRPLPTGPRSAARRDR